MKRLSIVLLAVITIILLQFNSVLAESGSPFYAHYIYTPRWSYIEDSSDNEITLKVYFTFYNAPLESSYNLRFEQIDYDGNYIKLLTSKDYTPVDTGVEFNLEFEEDFSKIYFGDSNIAFYRIVYNNINVYSGAVMKRPNFEALDSSRIEFGDYVYNDDALPDITNQEQYTINQGDYLILHYRFDSLIASDPTYDLDYVIHDLSTGVYVDSFTMTEIISSSLYNVGVFGSDVDVRNSFTLISTNGSPAPFAITSFDLLNDTNLYTNLSAGTYQLSLRNDSGNWVDSPYAPLNVSSSNNKKVFDLMLSSDYYKLGDSLILTFVKDNASSNDAYSTYEASDTYSGSFDFNAIDSFTTTKTLYYDMSDTIVSGDTSDVLWSLMITNIAFGSGSVDTTYYKISLSDSYTVIDYPNFEGKINNLMSAFNWDNDEGYMLVSFILFLIVNVLLAMASSPFSAIVIINSLLLVFLIFIGFASAWFSLIIGLLIVIGLLSILRSDV